MLDAGFFRLEHFESYEENQDPTCDFESRNGNSKQEEDRFTQQDKQENNHKSDGGGFPANFPFGFFVSIFYQGGENRNVCDGIHDRKKSGENRKRKGNEFVLQKMSGLY